MRFIFSLIMFLGLVSILHAQDASEYSLHIPIADEYLAALPGILDQARQEGSGLSYDGSYTNLVFLTWTQLQSEHSPLSNHPYERLALLYPYYTDNYLGNLGRDMVTAWLREYPINLDNVSEDHPLILGKLRITADLRDFNGDGEHEWILNINQDDRYRWKEVIQAIAPRQYQEIETPLFTFDSHVQYLAGFSQELTFEDLNQDGLPEWVIAVGGMSASNQSYGALYILQWQEGKLIDLAADSQLFYVAPAGGGSPGLFPFGTTVKLKDVDGNGTIEIQVQQMQDDNWGCTWTQTRIYGWRNEHYTLLNESRRYDDVKGCAWRNAEGAMWRSDYRSAIMEYEKAYTLPFAESIVWNETEVNNLWEYEQVRLALAYALTHQKSRMQDILDNLKSSGIHSDAVQAMTDILEQNTQARSDVDICQAIYDLWFGYVDAPPWQWETDSMFYGSRIPLKAYIGQINENSPVPSWSGLPQPEKAGCDISAYDRPLSKTQAELYTENQSKHPLSTPPTPDEAYHPPAPLSFYDVMQSFKDNNLPLFLIQSRFYLMQIQHGIVHGDEWMASYLFATALRLNNRTDEALEQYLDIYQNSPLASWRQLAGLYLRSSKIVGYESKQGPRQAPV